VIDTVIFDLEGVIIDTEPLWDNSNRLFLQAQGVSYNRAAIKPLIAGKSLTESTRVMREALSLSGDLSTLEAQRKAIIEEQLRAGSTFIPGFLQFHSSIRASYKLCVATSMDTHLLGIVDQQLDLSALFGGKLFSIADVENLSKPDPALFLYAAQQMGSHPETCVVIEDAPSGVQAARNARMKCIALASTFDRSLLSAADRVVSSYEEIHLTSLLSEL